MSPPVPHVQVGVDVADDLTMKMSVYQFFEKLGNAIVNRWIPSGCVFIFTMMLAYILPKLLATIVYKFLGTEHYAKVAAALFRIFLVLFGLYCTFELLTMDLLTFALTFGISGLGVNLALVNPLGEIFSGILIRMQGNVKEGDVIKIGPYEGVVAKIGVFKTIIINGQSKAQYKLSNRTVDGDITVLTGTQANSLKLKKEDAEFYVDMTLRQKDNFNLEQYFGAASTSH